MKENVDVEIEEQSPAELQAHRRLIVDSRGREK